ncbi:hypothetical protein XENOCAPTIV_019514 [Xenoophorus captivus]|uniref:Uncharacterized protein n=1 Tax=Xenoophorus captivus TaxID=1517983 RepID=A0ABV0RI62_9TELE
MCVKVDVFLTPPWNVCIWTCPEEDPGWIKRKYCLNVWTFLHSSLLKAAPSVSIWPRAGVQYSWRSCAILIYFSIEAFKTSKMCINRCNDTEAGMVVKTRINSAPPHAEYYSGQPPSTSVHPYSGPVTQRNICLSFITSVCGSCLQMFRYLISASHMLTDVSS